MKRLRSLACLLTLCLLIPASAQEASPPSPLPPSLGPVRISGSAGPLLTWGDDARPILLAGDGAGARIVGATSTLGRGRVVALGHESFLGSPDEGAVVLVAAAAGWASREGAIAVDERFTPLAEHLRESGATVVDVGENWLASLDGAAAVVISPARIREADLGQIRRYIGRGGGLVTGSPGWGWQQLNPRKSLRDDFILNALFHPAGIAWTDEAIGGGPFTPVDAPSPLFNVENALDAVNAHRAGGALLEADQLRLATNVITRAAEGLPTRERNLLPRIDRLLMDAATSIPTPQKPLGRDDPLAQAALRYQTQKQQALPADEVEPHPAAATFPGGVAEDAARVKRSVSLDLSEPGWKSTGLYAAPGEAIHVMSSPGTGELGLEVQIGCHTDRNWNLAEWTRVPEITIRRDLTGTRTDVAGAFGGPVYVIVPEGPASQAKVILEIEGAVEAPMFVLGETSLEDWRQTIRHHPAPWAELVGNDIILSLPSRVVRNLEDPQRLMAWWDRIVQVQGELSPRPKGVTRPERIVADQQIVAGYMHAGYPIMTWLDIVEEFVDYDRLSREGNWGIFHEIGHNHQWGEWTFDGTGEVTNNIFAVYTYDRLVPEGGRHPGLRPEYRARTTADLQGAADAFKQDPFFALYMYLHLVEDFGWEPFQKFFAEYATLAPDERPRTDQEERDRWLTRMSHHTGRNLEPLFTRWGVETSQEAQAKVAELPPYEPTIQPPPPEPAGELME